MPFSRPVPPIANTSYKRIKVPASASMPDFYLALCYGAITDGLPVMRLREHQYFEWDHDTHNIHTLSAFSDNFETVLQIFRAHNFAEEYARRWRTEPERFAPHFSGPEFRHSTAQIEQYFGGLRDWIRLSGVDRVQTRIEDLFAATEDNHDAFMSTLRTLMLHPACTPATRPPALPKRGEADLSRLLHRMHTLNYLK